MTKMKRKFKIILKSREAAMLSTRVQQRRRVAAPAAVAGAGATTATTAAYRRVHESTGLSMAAIGGWPHAISFIGQT